jgi:hypothetical protein
MIKGWNPGLGTPKEFMKLHIQNNNFKGHFSVNPFSATQLASKKRGGGYTYTGKPHVSTPIHPEGQA